jgi:hypothetical protein
MTLFPYQKSFVDMFFNPQSKRVILLSADIGLGMSATLAELTCRLMQQQPAARLLFLVPAALKLQTENALMHAGVKCIVVDRYRYREMLELATSADLWPRGTVTILSLDFAKQLDIRNSLED